MISWLYDGENSSASAVIISIAIILLTGFLMTRLTKKLRLPNVTAYIVAGILIGPYCLNLIPPQIIEGRDLKIIKLV
ncbi:MAG: cation:proton antiporter [Treponema sp.]|nr:cation:proton antiporter [Treponema sp.]